MLPPKKTYSQALSNPGPILERPDGEENWVPIFGNSHRARHLKYTDVTRLFTAIPNTGFQLEDQPILVSVDCERNQLERVTEIGIAWLDYAAFITNDRQSWSAAKLMSKVDTKHYRILETACDPHTDVERYSGRPIWQAAYSEFCQSFWISKNDVHNELTALFGKLREQAGVEGRRQLIFVGHDLRHDPRDLLSVGYNLNSQFSYLVDTQRLAKESSRSYAIEERAPLTKIVKMFDIKEVAKHNGANDAVYTMAVLIGLVFINKNSDADDNRDDLVPVNHSTPSSYYNPDEPERGWYEDMGKHVETLRFITHQPTSLALLPTISQLCNTCGVAGHTHEDCTVFCFLCGSADHGQGDHSGYDPLPDVIARAYYAGSMSYLSGKLALPEGRLQLMQFRVDKSIQEQERLQAKKNALLGEVASLKAKLQQAKDEVVYERSERTQLQLQLRQSPGAGRGQGQAGGRGWTPVGGPRGGRGGGRGRGCNQW